MYDPTDQSQRPHRRATLLEGRFLANRIEDVKAITVDLYTTLVDINTQVDVVEEHVLEHTDI